MRDAAARARLRSPETFIKFDMADCEQTIPQRFEQQVRLRPHAPAVRLWTGDITYGELNHLADRAAQFLLAQVGAPLQPTSPPIAMLMEQGFEVVLWILAILKAGFCYAPVDQRLSESALCNLIEHLEPVAIVAGSRYQTISHALASHLASRLASDRIPVIDAATISLDRSLTPESIEPVQNAAIFYTSGSTGTPKGVVDSHRNILHNIRRYTNSLRFAPGDILSLIQNPSFSGMSSSLWGALLNGAAIAPFSLQGDGLQHLSQWLRELQVTVFHAVPSIFRQLADPNDRFPSVRLIRLEGDRCSELDLRHFRAHFQADCTLVNGLGATECGLVRQFFISQKSTLAEAEAIPVGYSVSEMTVSIQDPQGQSLSPNAIGEIVVESQFLATAYWRNPSLTAEKFTAGAEGKRRYHTGDLGKMTEDGCLVHLGRRDDQIRIAGEFIDAIAIEQSFANLPEVQQAIVRDFVDHLGERRLCAYVVVESVTHSGMTVDRLRTTLAECLDLRLMPSAFVLLEHLPLTVDRKVDLTQLPPPGRQRPVLSNAYVLPQTVLEQQIAQIWSEVLDVEPIGALDSFFDLGGDSLRATQVINRLRSRHNLTLTLTALFEHQTIEAIATLIEQPRSTNA
jgi:acyl-coenzyme A synthetase/AMP-(fatty) acid ligase/acyl carrier protein